MAHNIYSGYLTKQNKKHNVFLYLPTIQAIQQFIDISQNQFPQQKLPQIFSFENIESQHQEQNFILKKNLYQIKQINKNVISPIKQKMILIKEFNKITNQIYQEINEQISKQNSKLKVNDIIPEFTFSKNIRATQFMVDEFIKFFNQILIDDIPEQHLTQVLEDLLEDAEKNLLRYTTIYFIKYMNEYWQKICRENNYQTRLDAKINDIKKLTINLKNISIDKSIIVAGSNATTNTMSDFLVSVAKRKNSAVVLTALETNSDMKNFYDVETSHHQYFIRNFLQNCAVEPNEVTELKSDENQTECQINRLYLIKNVMQSAKNIQWHKIIKQKNDQQKIIQNIKLIEAENEHQEIDNVISIIKDILKHKNKTISVVTADQDISRKIKNRLKTHHIPYIDQSKQRISDTRIAKIFLLIIDCFLPHFSTNHFFALIKNPSINPNIARYDFVIIIENLIRNYDGNCNSLEDIKNLLPQQETTEIHQWFDEIISIFQPLLELAKMKNKINIKHILQIHLDIFTNISVEESYKQKVMQVIKSIEQETGEMPLIAKENYRWFLYDFLTQININREDKSKSNPKSKKRVIISGLWEMRLIHTDCVIMTSLIEGQFPAYHRQSFWFGRDIADKIGFRDNSYQLGQTAHDFVQLCGKKQVWLTYAKKNQGRFNTPSCFFLRMKTLINAIANKDISKDNIIHKIHKITENNIDILPKPKPKNIYRPKKLTNYSINKLLHNPYQFYCEKILKLKPLNEMQKVNNQYELVKSLKKIIEQINNINNKCEINELNKIAAQIVINEMQKLKQRQIISQTEYDIWYKKISMIVENYLNIEKLLKQNIIKNELKPVRYLKFNTQQTKFILKCYVDRVIETKNDEAKYIIEYTNKMPTLKSFKQLCHPKTLLYNLAEEKNNLLANVIYLKTSPTKMHQIQYLSKQTEVEDILQKLKQNLSELLTSYEDENTPFLFKFEGKKQNSDHYSDYTHLSLVQHAEILGKI